MLVPIIALIQAIGPTEASRSLDAKTMATATVKRIITVIRGLASTRYSFQVARLVSSVVSFDFAAVLDNGLLNRFEDSDRASWLGSHRGDRVWDSKRVSTAGKGALSFAYSA